MLAINVTYSVMCKLEIQFTSEVEEVSTVD